MSEKGTIQLPGGETISCSFGYIDETGGILPKLARVVFADEIRAHASDTDRMAETRSKAPGEASVARSAKPRRPVPSPVPLNRGRG